MTDQTSVRQERPLASFQKVPAGAFRLMASEIRASQFAPNLRYHRASEPERVSNLGNNLSGLLSPGANFSSTESLTLISPIVIHFVLQQGKSPQNRPASASSVAREECVTCTQSRHLS